VKHWAIFLSLLCSSVSLGAAAAHGAAFDLDAQLRNEMAFNGAVLIVKSGETVFKECYGLAQREFKVPVASDTRFRIASLSKLFTGCAILKLQEEGRLKVSDELAALAGMGREPFAIHNLLTHTSGLPNYEGHAASLESCLTLMHMVDTQIRLWPRASGGFFSYADTNYLVLARVIEMVSEKPYAEFMANEIFGPLGMMRAGCGITPVVVDSCASAYVLQADGSYAVAERLRQPLIQAGSGDVYASLEDMEAFVHVLQARSFLSEESWTTLCSPQVPLPSGGHAAYGWFVREVGDKQLLVGKGRLCGYLSAIIHCFSEAVTLVILSNVESDEVFDSVRKRVAAFAFSPPAP